MCKNESEGKWINNPLENHGENKIAITCLQQGADEDVLG